MSGIGWFISYFGSLSLGLAPSTLALPIFSTQISASELLVTQTTSSPTPGHTITQGCTSAIVDQYIAAFRDPWQRQLAANQLSTTCGQTANPALIRTLKSERDSGVREYAAIALAYIGGPTATNALITALKTDLDPVVRKTAADGLGYIRPENGINPLITTLQNTNESILVRQAAAEALGDIGSPIAVTPLMSLLKNTQATDKLRLEAATALQKIGEAAVDPLVSALQSSDLRTRYWSSTTLAAVDSPHAAQALQANQIQIIHILDAAIQADIVEFERVPAPTARRGTRAKFKRRPIVCRIDWVARRWKRCN